MFWLSHLKTLLFPPTCAFCQEPTEEYYSLCPRCWLSLRFINRNTCCCCGEMLNSTDISPCCWRCRQAGFLTPHQEIIASLAYDDVSKPSLLRLKERNEPQLALVFARFFNKRDWRGGDFLVPVPQHPLRLWQRTYSQSALLALGIRHWHPDAPPVRLDLLKRTRYTPKQKGRNAEQRLHNVQGCFTVPSAASPVIKEKSLILIDDVAGSGATLSECKRTLLEAGAREVRTLVLAKSV